MPNGGAIGIDVGGTKILGVRVDPGDPTTIRARHQVETPGPRTDGEPATALLDAIVAAVEAVAGPESGSAPETVGVGIPGLVDREGTLRVGPHLPGLEGVEVRRRLVARLPTDRVVVDNDAHMGARAEALAGAAAGATEALFVALGTGIGAGVIVEGAVVRGRNGFAGEPGHMLVVDGGHPCSCGRRGCWEQYASGSALGRLAREAALSVEGVARADVRGEHVVAAARAGDDAARQVLEVFARWVGLGLANLVTMLDPAIVVLGGGITPDLDLVLPAVRHHVRDLAMYGTRRPEVPVVAATTGPEAGAIGAALAASTRTI